MNTKIHKKVKELSKFILFLLFIPGVCVATDRYVDPVIGVDNATCDVSNPCLTLTHAVGITNNNDVVHLQPGTYAESPINVTTDITIRGSGRNNTFIEPTNLPNRIFNISSNNMIIAKVTLQNGDVYDVGSGTFENGGAILLNTGSLILSNVNIFNSEALAGGAVEQASSGYLFMLGTFIQDNWASAVGGALHCDTCGGVYTFLSGVMNNTAGSEGGAMYMVASDMVSIASNFSRNDGDKGGALSALSSEIHLFNSQLSANVSRNSDGGAIFGSGLGLNVQKTTFSGNDASNLSNGGAIALFGSGWLAVANSTFSSNIAHAAGAIALIDNFGVGPISAIHHSTFYGNTGNLLVNNISLGLSSAMDLYNSIISNGGNPFADDCSIFGAMAGGNNLIDDGTCGFVANPVNNIDATLQFNGGITMTHALLAGSNAIDGGDNTFCTNPYSGLTLSYDQRGRFWARNVGAACDVGSFEVQ